MISKSCFDKVAFSAEFVPIAGTTRLVTVWVPTACEPLGVLVVLPPFAEELNRSRRSLAASGRLLAESGYAFVLPDLYGCGDSAGEFSDASWSLWCDDLTAIVAWVRNRFGHSPFAAALRSGSLFLPDIGNLFSLCVLWQPVLEGNGFVRQQLRAKVMKDKMEGAATTLKDLMVSLEQGQRVEVAGYELNPALVLPMAERSLLNWVPARQRLVWLETGQQPPPPGEAVRAWLQSVADNGCVVEQRFVPGPPFWSTLEIAENTALADATRDALSRGTECP